MKAITSRSRFSGHRTLSHSGTKEVSLITPRRALRYGRQALRRIDEGYRSYRRDRSYHFLIYACARTGSTSLRQALDCYAGICTAPGEPFNAHRLKGKIPDLPSLQRDVDRLWHRYNGFKHVVRSDRSVFQEHSIDDHLLTSAASRVVLLNRRNALQRAVSLLMGQQTGVWQLRNNRGKVLDHRYEPLDKAAIRQELADEHAASVSVKRRLDESGLPYMTLWYEDVFGDGSVEQRLLALGEVIAFITGRPFRRSSLHRNALRILNPTKTRVNSAETYERVPRIHEIDEEFGSAETGYLFR
ncbi:MAG: hypothetical protein GIW94_01625 [Candidatus Eremiobacteraeota bacterium]|nr:hypothetical protein [Candidatus Eremiobacteraeota bacterium]